MEEEIQKKEVIDKIRNEIEGSKGTRIWGDYINALKLIAQVVFTRSSGFILELIQNAEDAGIELEGPGGFEIKVNKERVKISHNGKPFSEEDVKALCGIRSSKKPERGTLGYLGIGFKSIFKVTDSPEIYSNGFKFKFDRNAWDDASNTPWHVIPMWVEKPSESVEDEKTTFIIPFREEETKGSAYSDLSQEIQKLGIELYLFLGWLKKIKITDEESGEILNIENLGETEEGITTLRRDGREQKFRFFRKTVEVPEWVKKDRLTQEYRANVTKREISIAFALDVNGNLAPFEAGAMYGGVYSFLPLGEAKSGARFPIQADFLVQPGRDAINYEAKWNQWLLGEVTSLCKEAIRFFKTHDKWKYQFLPTFEFNKSKGLEAYDKLFGPVLIEPIDKFLEEDACVPTWDGGWAKPEQTVCLAESSGATSDLIKTGTLKESEIASIAGGEPNLKLAHPEVKESYSQPLKKVDRQGILANDKFLEQKGQQPDAPGWFRNLYLWLIKNPIRYKSGRSWYTKRYHEFKFVLTSERKILNGGEVWLPDISPTDPILKDLADTLQKSRNILHPDILAGAKDEEEARILRGFLTGYTGVQLLNSDTVLKLFLKEHLLPKILTISPAPTPEELLKSTVSCYQIYQIIKQGIEKDMEFWVVTKEGDVRRAKEVLLSKKFNPEQDWESHKEYVPGISFLSSRYIEEVAAEEDLKPWREFFKEGGIKEAPVNGVEIFAENYVEKKLTENKYKNVLHVDKMKLGYDIQAESPKGERVVIEVKGQAFDQDAELTGGETEAADKYKENFYLHVVSSIPDNPSMYVVQNPAAPGVGKKDKLTIPINIWKSGKVA
jgi:hypothetical protein